MNFRSAIGSLFEHCQRTLLSSLGVMVGSLAVILLISVARGVQRDITKQVNDLGVNVLVVIPGRIDGGAMFSPNLAGLSYLSEADVAKVRRVPGVLTATPLMFVGGAIRYGDKVSPSTFVIAANSPWFQIRPVEMAEGRPFSSEDAAKAVCVIGSVAKEHLFGQASALGKEVLVNGKSFKIVGVTRDKSNDDSLFSMGGFENVTIVPFDYLKAHVPNPQVHRIMLQTAPDREPKALVAMIERVLGERLNRDTFSVLTQKDLLKLVYQLMDILTWLLTGLTSIGLFVGGVGIMVIMLMSVNERAKEIGVRKAVGARNRDIFRQFLVEAGAIGLLGGAMGLGISAIAALVLSQLTPIHPLITLDTVALGFFVSVGVGGVFGIVPAMRASIKDPVVSLRSE
ncbi:MAG: ABC transporter permease [Fimbriimonadaceae bacterium]|nr:ABC transporter permease [Fimbriimonadaceae bacterium]